MAEPINMMLACCVLNRKRLISELKKLPSGGMLEFTVELTGDIREYIQKILEEENCRLLEVNDENGTTLMIVEKI